LGELTAISSIYSRPRHLTAPYLAAGRAVSFNQIVRKTVLD
jgi:hypothetical protein